MSVSFCLNLDKEPPTIYCPQNQEVKKKSDTPTIKVFWPKPTYRDNSGQAVTIFTESINGSDFRTGSYPVNYEATDHVGNKASCSFVIVVSCKFVLYVIGDGGTFLASLGGEGIVTLNL